MEGTSARSSCDTFISTANAGGSSLNVAAWGRGPARANADPGDGHAARWAGPVTPSLETRPQAPKSGCLQELHGDGSCVFFGKTASWVQTPPENDAARRNRKPAEMNRESESKPLSLPSSGGYSGDSWQGRHVVCRVPAPVLQS